MALEGLLTRWQLPRRPHNNLYGSSINCRQIGGKGRVLRTGNTGDSEDKHCLSAWSDWRRRRLTKGPILAEKIEERGEECWGAGSPGVRCDQCVVCTSTVLVLITKLTMYPPGVPARGDQFARAEFNWDNERSRRQLGTVTSTTSVTYTKSVRSQPLHRLHPLHPLHHLHRLHPLHQYKLWCSTVQPVRQSRGERSAVCSLSECCLVSKSVFMTSNINCIITSLRILGRQVSSQGGKFLTQTIRLIEIPRQSINYLIRISLSLSRCESVPPPPFVWCIMD